MPDQPTPEQLKAQIEALQRQLAELTGERITSRGDRNVNVTGGVQGDVTINLGTPTPPEAGQPKPSADRRLNYLNALIGDCNRLRLSGLDPTASDPTRARPMTLDQVYVGLDTRSMRSEFEQEGKPDDALSAARLRLEREQKPLSALEAISRAPNRRAVLLGQPGSGKSTLAHYLALRLAQSLMAERPDEFDWQRCLPGWERGALLPVVVSLGRLAQNMPAEAKAGSAEMVLAHLRSDVPNCYDCGEWVANELERADGLVIFDGLDEVPAERRERVQQAVRLFADQHPRCVCLVTCRTYSYTRDSKWQMGGDWPTFELAPFDREKINGFIAAWYAALTQFDETRRATYQDKADKLRAALSPSDARQLYQLAGVPLLLTVMAAVHTHEDELPGSRALIYDKCVYLLLMRWESERTADREPTPLLRALNLSDPIKLDSALWEVAYRAHTSERRLVSPDTREDGSQPALVTEDLLDPVVRRWLGEEGARTFIAYCQTSNGLLMAQGTAALPDSPPESPRVMVYTFPHLTFEEFLAARHLETLPDMPGHAAGLAGNVRWREVILFLVEHLCVTGRGWQAQSILEKLCPPRAPKGEAGWRAVWLAGEGLPALRRATAADSPAIHALDKRIVQRLVALVAKGHLPALDRTAAGRTLAPLGDPRPGVGVSIRLQSPIPNLLWADLPAGTLYMGSRRGESFQTPSGKEGPYDDEFWGKGKPRAIPIKAFKLSAYPVTVAQFRPFVESPDGWVCDEWWTQAGVQDRGDAKSPNYWDDPQWRIENHPVVGVTWYAAVAYCRWLTARLRVSEPQFKDVLVRLPTEAEWEWAARGPDARRWPWDDEWRADACNSDEAQIGRTSAVGIFPSGVNWTGNVYDLAGNVWEWCATRWQEKYDDNYPALQGVDEWSDRYLDGDAPRVFRGGSFDSRARLVRGASRNGVNPGGRGPDRGFRCVCASGSSSEF